MSDWYGYADDYKVVGTNNFTMQIDATKVWKWCTENLINLNVSKCKVLSIKEESKVTNNGWELGKSEKEKDLEVMIHKDLTWTANANRRCEKALKAFLTIKRNVARGTAWQAKKNLYRSYIVPIHSYGSVLWKPNKQDLKKVDPIQMKATKWILSTGQLTYKDRLRSPDILPLSLYDELTCYCYFWTLSVADTTLNGKISYRLPNSMNRTQERKIQNVSRPGISRDRNRRATSGREASTLRTSLVEKLVKVSTLYQPQAERRR